MKVAEDETVVQQLQNQVTSNKRGGLTRGPPFWLWQALATFRRGSSELFSNPKPQSKDSKLSIVSRPPGEILKWDLGIARPADASIEDDRLRVAEDKVVSGAGCRD